MSQKNALEGISFSSENPVKDMLSNTENYKVMRICLKKGLIRPLHTGDHTAFFLVLKGRGIFTLGSKEVELETNGFVKINKGEVRGIQSLEDLVILAVRE
ncbi:MAG: cupin domain-containing protein [Promethearchaeota archaeon]